MGNDDGLARAFGDNTPGKYNVWLVLLVFLSLATSAGGQRAARHHRLGERGGPVELSFDFSEQPHGFIAGFADYPVGEDAAHALAADHRDRPPGVGAGKALYISGDNHSDDLFMFFKKSVEGLRPETAYIVRFRVELASRYPTGSTGIGGSPGDSVYLKAGASTLEPGPIQDCPTAPCYWRMNVDKGHQSFGGADAVVLGTIAKPDDGTWEYVLIARDGAVSPMTVTTDAGGRLWLFVGTDSGFEGVTSLFYTRVTVTLSPQGEVPARLVRRRLRRGDTP